MTERSKAREVLERSQIQWHRDWDALAMGYVVGSLLTLAAAGLGIATWVPLVIGIGVGWIVLATQIIDRG